MFSEELKKLSWEETTERIASMTDTDVRRALAKEHCDVNDFMAMLSPAVEHYLETMARLSRKYTEERFGKTMSMFIPLYITNWRAPFSPLNRLKTSTKPSSSWRPSRTSCS